MALFCSIDLFFPLGGITPSSVFVFAFMNIPIVCSLEMCWCKHVKDRQLCIQGKVLQNENVYYFSFSRDLMSYFLLPKENFYLLWNEYEQCLSWLIGQWVTPLRSLDGNLSEKSSFQKSEGWFKSSLYFPFVSSIDLVIWSPWAISSCLLLSPWLIHGIASKMLQRIYEAVPFWLLNTIFWLLNTRFYFPLIWVKSNFQ